MILKITREKSNAFQKTYENLNFFLDDVKNAKNDAHIKNIFFWIFVVFRYF